MVLLRVCKITELEPGHATRVAAASPVAVFRLGDEFYATDDTCTHAQASLAEGYIAGDAVECAFHSAKFCIRTGQVRSLPATRPLRTYPVKIVGDEIYVDLE